MTVQDISAGMLTWDSVPGTEIQPGDYVLGNDGTMGPPLAVNLVIQRQHPLGARYADLTLEDGSCRQCWQGFLYRVGR
jgi:hypothetical protein